MGKPYMVKVDRNTWSCPRCGRITAAGTYCRCDIVPEGKRSKGWPDDWRERSQAQQPQQWSERDYHPAAEDVPPWNYRKGEKIEKGCGGHNGSAIVYTGANGQGAYTLAGASAWKVPDADPDIALIIDCGDVLHVGSTLLRSNVKALQDLARYAGNVPYLKIDWPNMGVPRVRPEFWLALLQRLPAGRIVACCQGGHGRTGTCLAALLIADGHTANDAIRLVRQAHCSKAVESRKQEEYLADLDTALNTGRTSS